jgi:hypothetical protein
MNNIQKRFLLFLFGCIGIRTLLVYIAKTTSTKFLMYMGYLAIPIGFSFLYLFFGGLRKTGPEVFGEKIWWNDLRPIHGILYLLFAYFAITGNKNAWLFLLVDVLIGLVSFLVFHYKNGNFKKLI